MRIRRLLAVVRDAAWPGLVVLVAHGALAKRFGHEPLVDPLMHLAGGAAAAFFFLRLRAHAPALFDHPRFPARALLAFTATTTVAVLWEIAELLSDRYLGTRTQAGLGTTLRDIVNGMAGAAACIAVAGVEAWRARVRADGAAGTR
jgi:hypothetical protein